MDTGRASPARSAALSLALALLPPPAAGPAPASGEATVVLLHTNDLHGRTERAAALAALARAEEARHPGALWLDAGDAVGGTPVSSATRGLAPFEVATAMGVDVACLGNHEFDHGFGRIEAFRAAAGFPILCANAEGPDGRPLADAETATFERGGVRVAVVGIVTGSAALQTVRRGNEGVRFGDPAEALRRIVPGLRRRAELVVALSHCGFDADVALAREVPGIDVIVGGHSHTDLPGPVRIGRAVVVQAGARGERLGRLVLRVDRAGGGVRAFEGASLPVPDGPGAKEDPAVARLARELAARCEAGLDEVLARAPDVLDRAAVRALAEEAMREAADADAGWQNDGGVRAEVRPGPVTLRDAWACFPFDNTVVVLEVPGRRLPAAVRERMASAPEPERTYRIAVNAFLAEHAERYFPGPPLPARDTGLTVRDAFAEHLRRRGAGPVGAPTEPPP